MYKLLLCWRYLRTRWIALASVVSVTLGVATMIVVNAVMAGFAHEMQSRIHGILSDLVFESHSLSGFQDPKWHMEEIERAAGDQIAGMVLSFINKAENEEFRRKRGYTENICVLRPWRKQGLAKALIALSLKALKERGMDHAALGVDARRRRHARLLVAGRAAEPVRSRHAHRAPGQGAHRRHGGDGRRHAVREPCERCHHHRRRCDRPLDGRHR